MTKWMKDVKVPAARRTGIPMRDYFAAQALTGMLSNSHEAVLQSFISVGKERGHKNMGYTLAEAAYEYADAMLKARGEQP